MAQFITRVELHNATYKDYEILHAAMLALKFHKTIKGGDGNIYQLPTAEYSSFGDLNVYQVKGLAEAAAKRTACRFWILTTEYSSAAWILNQANALLSA
jgi:hypothetical protein